jgi:uncharacterized membrane protein
VKISERQSLWYHSAFSLLLCTAMVGLIVVRRDIPTLLIVATVLVYVAGNTLLHMRRHDFRKETFYEYVIVATAVLVVLLGAARH